MKKSKNLSKNKAKKSFKHKLLEFYGTECSHCRNMHPLVARLQKELKVKVQKFEVWHNDKNAALMESIEKGRCGGVPFFYNSKTHDMICGEVDYESLKKWAKKK